MKQNKNKQETKAITNALMRSLCKTSRRINSKTEIQSEFYILRVERDWYLDLVLSFLGEVFSDLVASILHSYSILEAGWLSWWSHGSMILRKEGIHSMHPSFGLG